MTFLGSERETLEQLLPKLDAALREQPLAALEARGGPAIALGRRFGVFGLLLPRKHGGLGADALAAVRVQRALGARAPSLAVAATMHGFSLATLAEYSSHDDAGLELLEEIGAGPLLLASGFAEGRSGQGILRAALRAEPVPGGYRLYGAKRPCTLSLSMDLLTASVAIAAVDGAAPQRGIAVVDAGAQGLRRQPFWHSPALAGAESDELILDGVFVPQRRVFACSPQLPLDRIEFTGFVWFELLVCASYLGMASGLAERVLLAGKGDASERAQLGIELEGAMAALEGTAAAVARGGALACGLAPLLFVRFSVQQAIERAAQRAAELLGGMAFAESPDVALLLAACRALAFHPPSRATVAAGLADHLAGKELQAI